MDPKQTEGQQPGSGTLSTGANISRTMNDLNLNDRKSATFNSPFAKHRFQKVAPQTGDILIDPSRSSVISSTPSEKKGVNRGRLIQFGLIFGGIALIGLVIFTVVMLINRPKDTSNSSGNSNTASITGTPKELFEKYLQKLVTGEVGKTTYTASDGKTYSTREVFQAVAGAGSVDSNILYADKIISSDSSDNRSEYINELNSVFGYFSSTYSGANKDDLDDVSSYYYDFANIQPVFEGNLINSYQNNGYDQAVADIIAAYGVHDNIWLNEYSAASSGYSLAVVNLLNEAKAKLGCDIISSETAASCTNLSSLETYQAYINAGDAYRKKAMQVRQILRGDALNVLSSIYLEYYDVAEESNEEEQL